MTRRTLFILLIVGIVAYFGYRTVSWYFRVIGDERDNRISKTMQKDLVAFKVSESDLHKKISSDENDSLPFGLLWTDSNPINLLKNQDTIIIKVNTDLATPLDFDGGIEFSRDTLFLYAQRLRQSKRTDKVHSTLTYKIISDKTFSEIVFKNLD